MILPEHLRHHERLGVFKAPMLMLGAQEDHTGVGRRVFGEYTSLDPDGGDIRADLAGDLSDLYGRYETVYNLGTIEHLWDCHAAYCNAARMVCVGGHFMGHSPVGGYENHGVHVTGHRFILDFFRINGFEIIQWWLTDKDGNGVTSVERGGGNVLLWFAARKITDVVEFKRPQQRFENGAPV